MSKSLGSDSPTTSSGSGSVESGTLSCEDRETRLLLLVQKSDQLVGRITEAMPSALQQLSGADVGKTSGESCQPAAIVGCELRPYQLRGVEWLCGIHASGLSGILADEMGLGTLSAVVVVMSDV